MAHAPQRRLWPLVAALMIDAVALIWFWHALLRFRRPVDNLCFLLIFLGILTAIAGGRIVRSAALVVVSLAVCLLAVEMGQKFFDFLSLGPRHSIVYGASGQYPWNTNDALTYVAIRHKAIEAGDYDPALAEKYAGDIFAGRENEVSYRATGSGSNRYTSVEALFSPFVSGSPTGLDHAPNNEIRYRAYIDGGETLFDGHITTNKYGFRTTPRADEADSTVIFLGCSQTFGYGLCDDETTAYAFAEKGRFQDRVLNISTGNAGPHQSLRELELENAIGRSGVRPESVRGVVFTLIDDHPNRVVHPNNPHAPYYRLEGGQAVYKGSFADSEHYGRLGVLLGRSRVFPTLADRLSRRAGGDSYKWRLTYAILSRMDAICRDRYGVGLTVVYWDETPEVTAKLHSLGIRVLGLSKALGENWRDMAIRYLLYDGHASAYANRLIGEMVHRELSRNLTAGL